MRYGDWLTDAEARELSKSGVAVTYSDERGWHPKGELVDQKRHRHIWRTDPRSYGLIDVCECGEARA